MPNPMAIRFHNGVPTEFASPIAGAVYMSVYVIILMTVALCSRWFAARFWWILFVYHILLDDNWSNKENRPKTVQRFASWIELVIVGYLFFSLLLQWLVLRANQMVPPQYTTFDTIVMVLGGCVLLIYAFTALFLLFRLPEKKD